MSIFLYLTCIGYKVVLVLIYMARRESETAGSSL